LQSPAKLRCFEEEKRRQKRAEEQAAFKRRLKEEEDSLQYVFSNHISEAAQFVLKQTNATMA